MAQQILCAWCGTVKGYQGGEHGISHGICDPCAERIMRSVPKANGPARDALRDLARMEAGR